MVNQNIYETDVLVIGSGIAGLRAACAARAEGVRVMLVSLARGASPGIMAFNAPVGPLDSAGAFYDDILRNGYMLNNKKLAKIFAEDIIKEINYLEQIGFRFDRDDSGDYHLLQAVGSSLPRLVHYKALTGIKIINLLQEEAENNGVIIQRPVTVYSLLHHDDKVIGAAGVDLRRKEKVYYLARAVVLATGGCGGIYPLSQYPKDIIGAGYGMAYRAGAELVDMEFLQFEPCVFVYPENLQGNPIPTTMLLEGAVLRNAKGEQFAKTDRDSSSKIRKNELAQAIGLEIAAGRGTKHGGVFYDVSMIPRKMLVVDHSIFYEPALKAGVDLTKEPAEVAPAPHTMIGGVRINERCESTVSGLFAAGEVAGGIHGANRTGGSAGAEILVFGDRAGIFAARSALAREPISKRQSDAAITETEDFYRRRHSGKAGHCTIEAALKDFREVISKELGLIKDSAGLKRALEKVTELEELIATLPASDLNHLVAACNFENMMISAKMLAAASLTRTESRGVHYRSDYPEQDDAAWLKNIVISQVGGEMRLNLTDNMGS